MRPRLAEVCLLFVIAWPLAPQRALGADVPKLAGDWTWTWKDANGRQHRHVLEVEGVGTKIAARERFDDEETIRVPEVKLEGKKVRFTVVRGEKRADYSGVVAADQATINGTVTITLEGQSNEYVWKAERKPAAKAAKRE